jgi:acetyl esterase/lipase
MKTPRACIVCLVIVCVARATSAGADASPEPVKCRIVEDVVYGNKEGMGLTLDVLTPETGAKHVGVILVSSGGWRSNKSDIPEQNEKRRNSEHWVQGLLQGGYTLFLTRHGSAPRYYVPEMIEDIRRGVRFVRLHAERFEIDPNHLGITSGSSGGHLALMVATTASRTRAIRWSAPAAGCRRWWPGFRQPTWSIGASPRAFGTSKSGTPVSFKEFLARSRMWRASLNRFLRFTT